MFQHNIVVMVGRGYTFEFAMLDPGWLINAWARRHKYQDDAPGIWRESAPICSIDVFAERSFLSPFTKESRVNTSHDIFLMFSTTKSYNEYPLYSTQFDSSWPSVPRISGEPSATSIKGKLASRGHPAVNLSYSCARGNTVTNDLLRRAVIAS